MSLSALGQTFSYFNKTWGDEFNYLAFSSVSTIDDGYIVFGSYSDTTEYAPLDLLKFDLLGNLQWRKNLCINSPNDSYILNKDMIQDLSGDLVLAATIEKFSSTTDSDIRIIKVSQNGEIIWKKDFGGMLNESISQLINTKDGGYLTIGTIQNLDPVQFAKIYILKIDVNGNKEWEESFGYEDEIANTIAVSAVSLEDGGFLIGGGLQDLEGSNSHLVIKIDSLGNYLWEKRFEAKCYISIYEMLDGNYLLSTCKYIDNDRYTYLIKTDTSLNIIWEKTYAPVNFPTNLFTNPIMKEDGGFVASVNYLNDLDGVQPLILEFDSLGNIVWKKTYTIDSVGVCAFTDVHKTNDGGYIWSGYKDYAPQQGWLLKTDCEGNTCSSIGCDSVYVHRDTLWGPLCGPLPYEEACLSNIDEFSYFNDTIVLVDSMFYDLPLIDSNSSSDFVNYYFLCNNDTCTYFKPSVTTIYDTGKYLIRGLNIHKDDSLILNTAKQMAIPLDSLQYFLDYNFACASVMNQSFELAVVLPEIECNSQINDFTSTIDSVTILKNYTLPELTSNNDSTYLNYYFTANENEVAIFQEKEVLYSEPDTIEFWGINIYEKDTGILDSIIANDIQPDALQNYFDENAVCASTTEDKFTLIVKEKDTGVYSLTETAALKITPNPASTKINIQTNLPKPAQIYIYNSQGKLIKTVFINSGDVLTNIEVSQWTTGLYFYQLISKDDVSLQSGKFSVQH